MDMGETSLTVLMSDSPEEAPNYERPDYFPANLTTVHVVGNGTESGNPTVDLIFETEHGQKYIAMLTGTLIEEIGGAVKGMRERTRK